MEIQNLPQLPLNNISIKIAWLLGRQYLLVPDQSKIRRILIEDIVRLEGIKNYTLFHLVNGNTLLSSRTLKVYELILQKTHFLRIHRAHLINMHCMKNFDEAQMLFAVMENEDVIRISRRKRKVFQQRMRLLNDESYQMKCA